jgi:hypothetical protein
MKVQLLTAYRVRHLQCYGITIRGNVTRVEPPKSAFMREVQSALALEHSIFSGYIYGLRDIVTKQRYFHVRY